MRRALFFLWTRWLTQRGPALGGASMLGNALTAGAAAALSALSGANGNSFAIDPATGHATTVLGPDMSHVPIFTHTSTPGSWATGVSGAGLARTKALITTTIKTTSGSNSATVSSAAGLANGMQIADIAGAISQLGAGTTITNIAGTTLTLSQNAVATLTAFTPVVAATWSQP